MFLKMPTAYDNARVRVDAYWPNADHEIRVLFQQGNTIYLAFPTMEDRDAFLERMDNCAMNALTVPPDSVAGGITYEGDD
jgi:hypothetical protein